MEFVYTHPRKNDFLYYIGVFLQMIKTRYDQTVRFFRMDDEPTLEEKFDALITSYGIIQKRTALYTSDQNEKTERSEKILTLRTKVMKIFFRLSANL